MMTPNAADAEEMLTRILDSAEMLLRRHGLQKLNVVDVARAMKMSHGNLYRHVPGKAALRAAVIRRWLHRISTETGFIAAKDAPADERLVEWLKTLAVIKQRKVTEDAELLAAAAQVVREEPDVLHEHIGLLRAQLAAILAAGWANGSLPGVQDAQATAIAVLNATARYHHPDMVVNGGPPALQMQGLEGVIALILAGLRHRPE